MMDNQKVNIYIETSVHGPSQHGGRCMYIMEYILRNGVPQTVRGGSEWRDKKENELALQALAAALARIKSPCVIDIYTSCRYIHNSIENGWLDCWRQNDWKTSKGQEVRHRKLWERIAELLEHHLAFVCMSSHSYKELMKFELRKQNDRPENRNKAEETPLNGAKK